MRETNQTLDSVTIESWWAFWTKSILLYRLEVQLEEIELPSQKNDLRDWKNDSIKKSERCFGHLETQQYVCSILRADAMARHGWLMVNRPNVAKNCHILMEQKVLTHQVSSQTGSCNSYKTRDDPSNAKTMNWVWIVFRLPTQSNHYQRPRVGVRKKRWALI